MIIACEGMFHWWYQINCCSFLNSHIMRQIYWKIWEAGIQEDAPFENRKQKRIPGLAWNSCQFSKEKIQLSYQIVTGWTDTVNIEVSEFTVLNARLTQNSSFLCAGSAVLLVMSMLYTRLLRWSPSSEVVQG